MKQLKNLSLFRNEYIYLAIFLVLVVVIRESWLMVVLFLLYSVFLYLVHPKLFQVGLVVVLLYFVRVNIVNQKTNILGEEVKMTVVSSERFDHYTTVKGQIKGDYYQLSLKDDKVLKAGEQYTVWLSEKKDKSGDIPYTFDLAKYDLAMNIKGRYEITKMSYIKTTIHQNQVIEIVDDYMKKTLPTSYGYVKTMVLADDSGLPDEVSENIRMLGISHLFAVSGLHIGLLVMMLRKGWMAFFDNVVVGDLLLVLFLAIYMVMTSFTPSVVRASLMVVFVLGNKYLTLTLDPLDLVSLIFVLLLLIHPYYYLQLGFQLSFLMTYVILLGRPLISSKEKLKSVFALSTLAFFATLPFVLRINQSANLLTIGYNGFYLFFVMFLILPLSYVTFLCPLFDSVYGVVIRLFENSIAFLADIDLFVIELVMNNVVVMVVYYVLLGGLLVQLEHKKIHRQWTMVSIIFIVYLFFQGRFVFYDTVHFVDVYGDATVVQSAFGRCTILIDTGVNDDYDSLIIYMKNNHIKQIDYFIISHPHMDHDGEKDDIFKAFTVRHYIDQSTVSMYPDVIECGNNQLFFYPMDEHHQNPNNNSLIMSLFVSGRHFLFTGDIESSVEEVFVQRYDVGEVDVLKVPHHGSITSSSILFIEHVNPSKAVVLVALKNTHNHPSQVVIDRYKNRNIEVIRTDQLGTIQFRYLFGKEWKKTSK